MKKGFIYKTTNTVTGKSYVGQHWTENENDGYLGSGVYIKNSIRKYGKKCFIREILEYCDSEEDANQKEIKWIGESNTRFPEGYNIAIGGGGSNGCKHSEATKAYLSELTKKQFATEESRIQHSISTSAGMTEEIRQKISDDNKKRLENPQYLEKMSTVMEVYHKDHPELAQRHSEYMKRLHSENPQIAVEHSQKMKALFNTPEMKEYCRQRALKQFKDPKQRELAADRAKGNKAHAKSYLISFPDGHKEEVTNLSEFCRNNNLSSSVMMMTANGDVKSHKGFSCTRLFVTNNENIRKSLPKNHGAKEFIITFSDGRKEKIVNLKEWCDINKYNYGGCRRLLYRLRKGYKDLIEIVEHKII